MADPARLSAPQITEFIFHDKDKAKEFAKFVRAKFRHKSLVYRQDKYRNGGPYTPPTRVRVTWIGMQDQVDFHTYYRALGAPRPWYEERDGSRPEGAGWL